MIVTSTYAKDAHTQPDGTRWVIESHLDTQGRDYRCQYLLPTSGAAHAVMASRAAIAEQGND